MICLSVAIFLTGVNMNKYETIKISHTEKSSLDYKAYLKPNSGFNHNYRVPGQTIIPTVIDYIDVTLSYDDMTPKYSLKNKTQILDLMKEQIEKALYQKEVKNLGAGKNTKNNNWKNSKGDSDALSWRKGSSGNSSSMSAAVAPALHWQETPQLHLPQTALPLMWRSDRHLMCGAI